MTFQEFGLPEALIHALDRLKFISPTPVQNETIPLVIQGRDVLVSSQTGTGKTGAFAIPIISQLLNHEGSSALVIAPTRELATQVMKTFQDLLNRKSPLNTALLIGGEPIGKQLQHLRKKPRIIVGTPGRINDHLKRKTLKLHTTKFLVLDETDRMLDMGFSVQIDDILHHIPEERQTLLFSATLPKNIIAMSKKYLVNPERIAVGSVSNPVERIKQEIIQIKEEEKYSKLLSQLAARDGSIIIFVKTKHGTEKMAKRLRAEKHEADAIHGDLRHTKREKVIKAFRNQKYRILVATDVAARGLDIPHIQHVINYDIPHCPEDYIHRIGRTARAGEEGEALSFVSPADKKRWNAIHNLMHPDAKKEMPKKKKPAKQQNNQNSQNNPSKKKTKRPTVKKKRKSFSPKNS